MRKKLLMAALLSCAYMFTYAQTQLINGGMEAWDNLGSDDEEPQQWNSFKTADCTLGSITCGIAKKQQVSRSTEIRPGSSGQYSARIYSKEPFPSTIANGNLTTGIIRMGSSSPANANNYNYTNTANSNFNTPITAKPDSIVFWAKYIPGNNSTSNTARMRATLHDNSNYRDPGGNTTNEVGRAEINYPRTHNGSAYIWQRFAIPFDYSQGTATTPSYILITFTTNNTPGGGVNNDQVWIDDVELKYVPITTSASTITPSSYTVSNTAGANISIPYTKTGSFPTGNIFTAQLSNASGSFATPVTLGTITSTAAGTINGTIPAGTPNGTGYRVRVVASSPYQTANDNGSDITINLISNSIAPNTAQTIAANTNGSILTVTESTTSTSREWKYASVSGGPYTSFTPAQSNNTYTPNFINAGTYHVVCETSVGSVSTRSNEVIVNVVKNQITPAGSQSLLTGNTGTTLTVSETPVATSREWLYATTSGGTYLPFTAAEIGTTYQPIFNTAGTYYVVAKSVISGIEVISNEVVISVGSINITTGAVTGSPFEFSASAPDATVNVPFTVSSQFNTGNTFTAQLSDANGSFASPTVIGTLTSDTDGIITASIPSNTPSGTGYLIRVIGSDPVVSGSDNGSALTVDQFSNEITPGGSQSFVHTSSGNVLSVSESQNASREWRISTVSGGPYTPISGQTGNTYTPSSPTLGTFYVIAASTNQHLDEVISNEVSFTVTNGSTITTSSITGFPFYVSASADNQVSVNFTSDVIFDPGNVFTAELSNASGSFILPVNIGSISATTPSSISAIIPNNTLDGTNYRIRVKSSSPSIIGSDNGVNLEMINYSVALSSADTQHVAVGVTSSPINLISTHPNVNVEWKFKTPFIGSYQPFNPLVTGLTFAHSFNSESTFIIAAQSINNWGDTLISESAVIEVTNSIHFGIGESNINGIKAFMDGSQFILDITGSDFFVNPNIELVNMSGQVVYKKQLQGKSVHAMPLSLASGIYTYRISENGNTVTGKIPVL